MDGDISKRLDHIENLVEDLAATTAKNFLLVTDKIEELDGKIGELDGRIDKVDERLGSKIDGLQRAIDSEFERQSALESRVTKIESELHI